MKRFWQAVEVTPDRRVLLDGRSVRTPARAPLILPTDALADAVAEEWRSVGETLDPGRMPLTGLANAAVDRVAADSAGFAAGLARYGESDLLCYRADGPAGLVRAQAAAWDPPLGWARTRYDVAFEIVSGIMHRAQPAPTVARLARAVAALSPAELAGTSPLVTLTGSLVLALAVAEGAMPPEAAWQASQVDEAWQAEQWGEDALALQARAARREEFDAAARFLQLVQSPDG